MELLIQKAKWLRLKVLEDIYRTKKGHIGGTYSCIELLIYLYYGKYGLRYKVLNPVWENRDRFVVGKGHICLALYNIWQDIGMLHIDKIKEYGNNGSFLGGQLNINTPGVEYNTGSLGHAIGIVSGMAIAAKINDKNYNCVALIGDGECSEGSIWESIMFAGQNVLNNIIGIIDCNKLGVTDLAEHSQHVELLENKLISFDWDVYKINGHDLSMIDNCFSKRKDFKKPTMIIADTIKGKGISFMENNINWHHSVPTEFEYNQAKKELSR